MSITIEGLEPLLEILKALPQLGQSALLQAVPDIVAYGEKTMRDYIVSETESSDKSTGELADNIISNVETTITPDRQSAMIEIGSVLPHAGFAAMDIGATPMHRNVFIRTTAGEHRGKQGDIGNYRFIGVRPPMPRHRFLELTTIDLMDYIERMYGDAFEASFETMTSPNTAAAMTNLFG